MDARWVHEAPSSSGSRIKDSSDVSCDWSFRSAELDAWSIDVIAGPVSASWDVETSEAGLEQRLNRLEYW